MPGTNGSEPVSPELVLVQGSAAGFTLRELELERRAQELDARERELAARAESAVVREAELADAASALARRAEELEERLATAAGLEQALAQEPAPVGEDAGHGDRSDDELETQRRELEDRLAAVEAREREVAVGLEAVDVRQADVTARLAALSRHEDEVERRATAVATRERELVARIEAVEARELELERLRAEGEVAAAELEQRVTAAEARERELADTDAQREVRLLELEAREAAITAQERELEHRKSLADERDRELAERLAAAPQHDGAAADTPADPRWKSLVPAVSVGVLGVAVIGIAALGLAIALRVFDDRRADRSAAGGNGIVLHEGGLGAPANAPPDVRDVRVQAGVRGVTLRWKLPAKGSLDRVEIVRSAGGGIPQGAVYRGDGTSFVDRDVVPGLPYAYLLLSYDGAGNRSLGVLVAAHPRANGRGS